MAYTTIDEMKKLIPYTMIVNLTNDVTGRTRHNQTMLDEAIDNADREIDAYLSVVMPVPVDPIPPLITNLSSKMAIWYLHLRKYFDNPQWRKTYDDCLALLAKIAAGTITIGPVDLDEQTGVPGSHDTWSRDQQFTDDVWETY